MKTPPTNPVQIAGARVTTLQDQVAVTKARIQDFEAMAAENGSASLSLADKLADGLAAGTDVARISEARETCRVREADLALALTKLHARLASEGLELASAISAKALADLRKEMKTLLSAGPVLRKRYSEAAKFARECRDEADAHDARLGQVVRALPVEFQPTSDEIRTAYLRPGDLDYALNVEAIQRDRATFTDSVVKP